MIKTVSEKCLGTNLLPVNIRKCFEFGMSTISLGSRALATKTKASGTASGTAIKKLNRENKSLFGPLIKKGKSTDKVKSKVTISHDTMQSPQPLDGLDGIQFEKIWQKGKQSGVSVIETDVIKTSEEPSTQLNPTFNLIPPDIIIRNMTLFPLLNKQKAADDWQSELVRLPRERSEDILLPSVTRILNATMSENSRAALARWKEKMIAELGEEGFEEYSRRLLSHGREFHSLLESHLTAPDEPINITKAVTGCWQSLQPIITEVSNVRAVESHVVHDQLKYHGVIDCVAEYRGQPAVIEWKKSDKQKPYLESTYDAPLQAAAYLGAANYDNNYHYPLHTGVVVVAYTDGAPAHVFEMNAAVCSRFWGLWLHRLQQYWRQQQQLTVTSEDAVIF